MTNVKIGLETHVQLDTDTKLFCGCPNEEAEQPNTFVCETCLGHPGSKPRLNKEVLEEAVKTSQALQCSINEDIFFSRKTYFYPDMSKNFQVTQYEIPVGENGKIQVKTGDEEKDIRIKRLHIEEDPARMKHVGGEIGNANSTLVDYNRAGTPLLEIVTKPDFSSPKEARAYLQQLAHMLEYLGIYQAESNYAIKSDANISIGGGDRVEVKNISGTAGIEKALNYEISRQKQLKKRGREVEQQTRNYNASQEITEKLREKETEKDYGYIFDPDLTRQELDQEFREKLNKEIPELPHEKFKRFKNEYGIKNKLVESLITEPSLADDFEQLAEEYEPETVASWLTGELKKVLNYNDKTYSEINFAEEELSSLLELLEKDEISDRNAEEALRERLRITEEVSAEAVGGITQIVEEQDLKKAEEDEVNKFIEQAIEENSEAVKDLENGDEEAVNFLVGQVMQLSKGKADPKTTRQKILEKLK